MIPRTPARRLLRDLTRSPRSNRPFTTTRPSLLKPIPPQPPQQPPQNAAASAALQNLSHLSPSQITALLSANTTPTPPAPPPQSRRSILLRRALWALFFFLAGYKLTADQIASIRFATPFLYPPADYEPEDIPLYRQQATYEALASDPGLDAMVPAAVSVSGSKITVRPTDWDHWEPYADFSESHRKTHLCAGALNNPNALGLVHMVFRHRLTGELILAVVFGQGTSGWPSVVHGGMLSTIMDEAMGRLAALNFSANTAVTAKLAMDFKEPVTPGFLYKVHVHAVLPELQKGPDGEDKTDRKLWICGRMEGPDGEIALEAKGLFVVPKGVDVKPLGKRF
ncbi:hypothetical protein COL922a_007355 [Colletotrichum nupharicola]|nr:hypothetical protein COL922a_007355 [Colletotrichum nupharicola]